MQQVDTPQTLYRAPANLFVAAFIGSPAMNLVEAEVDGGSVSFAGFRIPLAPEHRPEGLASGRVILGIRPQDLHEPAPGQAPLPTIEVEAAVVEELGSATHILFTIDAPPVDVDSVRAASDDNERATLLATDRRALFTAEVSEDATIRPGERVTLAVDAARLHFFDATSSESLRVARTPVGAAASRD